MYPKGEYVFDNLTWNTTTVEALLSDISIAVEKRRPSEYADKVASNVLHWLERYDLMDDFFSIHEAEELTCDNVGDWIIAGLEGTL